LNLGLDLSPNLTVTAIDSLDPKESVIFNSVLKQIIDYRLTQG